MVFSTAPVPIEAEDWIAPQNLLNVQVTTATRTHSQQPKHPNPILQTNEYPTLRPMKGIYWSFSSLDDGYQRSRSYRRRQRLRFDSVTLYDGTIGPLLVPSPPPPSPNNTIRHQHVRTNVLLYRPSFLTWLMLLAISFTTTVPLQRARPFLTILALASPPSPSETCRRFEEWIVQRSLVRTTSTAVAPAKGS